MDFLKYLDSMRITDWVLFVKEGETLKTWTVDGSTVLSCLGEYKGEEVDKMPLSVSIEASKLKEILSFAGKDTDVSFDGSFLIIENKDTKIKYTLPKPKTQKIPTPKVPYGEPSFTLDKDTIQKMLKARNMIKAQSITINIEDEVDFIIRGVVPGNTVLMKFDKINGLKTKQSFPNQFFEALSMCSGDKFDVYMTEVEGKHAPLKLTFADDTSSLSYFVAQRIEDKAEEKPDKSEKTKEE